MINIKNYDFYYKLRTLTFIEEIWLFGSRAKSTNIERSDIDLAIKCPKASSQDWQNIRSIIDSADTLLKIDLIRLDQLNDTRLLKEIEKDKQLLFKRVENNYPWYDLFLDLGEALDNFSNVLRVDNLSFPYAVEATIQIFEYSFELYWKLLKKICLSHGLECNSPRSTLEQSYAMKLIDNEQSWLNMMEDRNLTSHTYKRPTANLIYEHCSSYYHIMHSNYINIQNKFKLS